MRNKAGFLAAVAAGTCLAAIYAWRSRRRQRTPKREVGCVGFVGLGQMGQPMAQRLLGHLGVLTVWNRTEARAEPLRARGGSAHFWVSL